MSQRPLSRFPSPLWGGDRRSRWVGVAPRRSVFHPHPPASSRRRPGSSMLHEAAPAMMERAHRGYWPQADAGVTAGWGAGMVPRMGARCVTTAPWVRTDAPDGQRPPGMRKNTCRKSAAWASRRLEAVVRMGSVSFRLAPASGVFCSGQRIGPIRNGGYAPAMAGFARVSEPNCRSANLDGGDPPQTPLPQGGGPQVGRRELTHQ